jgi:hypothetical protein
VGVGLGWRRASRKLIDYLPLGTRPVSGNYPESGRMLAIMRSAFLDAATRYNTLDHQAQNMQLHPELLR